MNHIEYLKDVCSRPLEHVRSKYIDHQRLLQIGNLENNKKYAIISEIRQEKLYLREEKRIIRRIFVTANDTKRYLNIGWILCDDIEDCMICRKTFSYFSIKYHCHACGIVICYRCSCNKKVISELFKLGPLIVCSLCDYGQDVIHITPSPLKKEEYIVDVPKIDAKYKGIFSP